MLSSGFRKYLLVGGGLLVVTPLVFLMGHLLFNRWFLPSDHFRDWVVPVIVLFAAGWFALLLPLLVALARDMHWIGWLSLPLGTLAGAAVGLMFLSGPVSHALHVLSSPAETRRLETVVGKDSSVSLWRNTCRQHFSLRPTVPHLERKLCGISDALFVAVEVGDEVELEGTASRFGFEVTRIRPVEAKAIPAAGSRSTTGN
jgi:hypothetical protein